MYWFIVASGLAVLALSGVNLARVRANASSRIAWTAVAIAAISVAMIGMSPGNFPGLRGIAVACVYVVILGVQLAILVRCWRVLS